MKKIIFVTGMIMGFFAVANAQVVLQKAVLSNGGGAATNGTTNAMIVAGQAVAGTASNSQTIGHFGFFATPAIAASVAGSGAGVINSITLFPNPASEDATITIQLVAASNVDLFLYDAAGHFLNTIYSGKQEAGTFSRRLNTKLLPSGSYYIAARIPGALTQAKLTVVK